MKKWIFKCMLGTILTIAALSTVVSATDTKLTLENSRVRIQSEKSPRPFADAAEKWNALSEEQKNELYAMRKELLEKEGAILDKYAAYGVIDAEAADEIKSRANAFFEACEKDGAIPDFTHRRPHEEK